MGSSKESPVVAVIYILMRKSVLPQDSINILVIWIFIYCSFDLFCEFIFKMQSEIVAECRNLMRFQYLNDLKKITVPLRIDAVLEA